MLTGVGSALFEGVLKSRGAAEATVKSKNKVGMYILDIDSFVKSQAEIRLKPLEMKLSPRKQDSNTFKYLEVE
jgi:hypothetical protein